MLRSESIVFLFLSSLIEREPKHPGKLKFDGGGGGEGGGQQLYGIYIDRTKIRSLQMQKLSQFLRFQADLHLCVGSPLTACLTEQSECNHTALPTLLSGISSFIDHWVTYSRTPFPLPLDPKVLAASTSRPPDPSPRQPKTWVKIKNSTCGKMKDYVLNCMFVCFALFAF